ncbi:MAG: helix-turn-helix domain-containing protein [Mucilaginibacter sp.]
MMNRIQNYKIKAVAATIRNKREMRNYTQEYLAYKLNISQNAYSKIELGYTKITVERLFAIADILELDVIDFINTDRPELVSATT